MALEGKLETEIELKADAQKFYEIFKKQGHQVPNATPDHIQAVSVHEGDWETHGSVKIWQYTVGKHLIYTTLTLTSLMNSPLHFLYFYTSRVCHDILCSLSSPDIPSV
jgi:hypothetical protein